MEGLHLTSALMEYFLEGRSATALVRFWKVNSDDKMCIIVVFVTLLIWVKCTNVLTEQFLQKNVLLRHLLDEETLFMS